MTDDKRRPVARDAATARTNWRRRLLRALVGTGAVGVLLALNGPPIASMAKHVAHNYKINSPGYKQRAGHWSVLRVPSRFRVNAIHAALLHTGKVLIIAGSGNDRRAFAAGTFKTLLWDPRTDRFKLIRTPSDLFCGGHAFLPDGKLLIAGGTRRYEKLAADVTHAAGAMTIKNEDPNGGPVLLRKGTELVAAGGERFRMTQDVRVRPARKVVRGPVTTVTASATEVWVEAVEKGRGSVVKAPATYRVAGLRGKRADNLYGFAEKLTLDKQDYWGDDKSYLFDPIKERYERVDNMKLARWYPSLVRLKDGRVLAVSGLDQFGRFINGHNEIYDPATRRWRLHPELKRTFPTYPALFPMPNGKLFYTGSNAGYGSDVIGRHPGIWSLEDNSFRKVPGLRRPRMTETSGSVILSPAQRQRYMIAGGGGIGNSNRSTSRTDVIDLRERNPRFRPGPDLIARTRYPNMVVTPDDHVVVTGGSSGYRGENGSDLLICQLYDPKRGTIARMADPSVGRNYHSGALLLPDGRILTFGGDPLYRDRHNRLPGRFEKRIEIYSPPYLFRGDRPRLGDGPARIARGATVRFASPDAAKIASARLMRPSAVTHVTDLEQRSVAVDAKRVAGGVELTLPANAGLLPPGWYMLFAADREGTPSPARWVRVD